MRVGIGEATGCLALTELQAQASPPNIGYPQRVRAGNLSGGGLAPADEALEFASQKSMDVAFDLGPGEVPASV